MLSKDDLIQLAKSVADTFGLTPSLVCAVCEQESGWNPNATRFEPDFKERYIDRLNLSEEETNNRSTSWGLMQIMGQSAVEIGYSNPFEQLLMPEVGLVWGCRLLELKFQHARMDVKTALLLWNGGGNVSYPDEVLARVDKYRDGPNNQAMSA